jgi:hypothetical protein
MKNHPDTRKIRQSLVTLILTIAIKGTVSRDCRPSVFFINPPGPRIHGLKPFLNLVSNSRRYSTFYSPIFVHAVSKTPNARNTVPSLRRL